MKKISVLGSTGSIGTQTLEVVRKFPERFKVTALAAGTNIERLKEQIECFKPSLVSVAREHDANSLASQYPEVEVLCGNEGLCACATATEVDLVVMGVLGFAALSPTLAAVRAKKTIALANKEVIITAGTLLKEEIKANQCLCLPVDSEHNALYQLLENANRSQIRSVILTASGGPLLRKPELPLAEVTPEIAVKHPNWSMGKKISVDSCTLMNKGLEMIEAHYLFDFPPEAIEIWVHPQSLIHGLTVYQDNSYMAQMNSPDMQLSIGYAMAYPERLPAVIEPLSFEQIATLEFLKPDEVRFPALSLARQAVAAGASHTIALNALNEVAVLAFLDGKILFPQITEIIDAGLQAHKAAPVERLEDVFHLDELSRCDAQARVEASVKRV